MKESQISDALRESMNAVRLSPALRAKALCAMRGSEERRPKMKRKFSAALAFALVGCLLIVCGFRRLMNGFCFGHKFHALGFQGVAQLEQHFFVEPLNAEHILFRSAHEVTRICYLVFAEQRRQILVYSEFRKSYRKFFFGITRGSRLRFLLFCGILSALFVLRLFFDCLCICLLYTSDAADEL